MEYADFGPPRLLTSRTPLLLGILYLPHTTWAIVAASVMANTLPQNFDPLLATLPPHKLAPIKTTLCNEQSRKIFYTGLSSTIRVRSSLS